MILLPSKGRRENLIRFVEAYHATGGTEPGLVILESDDACDYADIELPDGWWFIPFSGGQGAASHHAKIYEKYPDRPYYAFIADDCVPRTRGWDRLLAQACMENAYAWPNDGERGRHFAMHAWIRCDLVKAAGGLNPLGLHHFGFDNFWFHLAKDLKVGKYCGDVMVEHMHPRVGKAEVDATYKLEGLLQQAADNPDSQKWRAFKASPEWPAFLNGITAQLGDATKERMVGSTTPIICRTPEQRHELMRSALARGIPRLQQTAEAKADPLVIACYGPSLSKSLPELLRMKETGAKIMTVSGAHDFLLDVGITPDYHVEVDPRMHKSKHYTRPQDGTNYLIASICAPELFDALKGKNVTLWHTFNDESDDKMVIENDPGGFLIVTGSTVGLAAMCLARLLGYGELHIFGMDSSLDGGERHAGPHYGKAQQVMSVRCGDRQFDTTPQMISAAREFTDIAKLIQPCSISLYGDGLLQTMTQEAARIADIAA